MSNNTNATGLPPPTIQGRLGSPYEAALESMNQRNASNAALASAVSGGSMRKKGGAITVPQVQTMYTSPGVSPNDINKSTHATSAQSKSDAEFDKLAMQGGKRRKRGGNPDWLWGCYSGGKKRKTRTNKRKTRKYRKKTRRNKK
jgi:hypothetical protein